MKAKLLRNFLFLAAALLAFATGEARAQAPLEPAQMPARTIFYLNWRGTPSADLRQANSLLALWDDPDFAVVRSGLAGNIFRDADNKPQEKKLNPDEIKEFASLLENPFTVGYISEPKHAAKSVSGGLDTKGATKGDVKAHQWNGLFTVYDASGKEALLAKLLLKVRAAQNEPRPTSQITLAGVPVTKIEGKTSTSYWAQKGKFTVGASESSVMEEILGRLGDKRAPGPSLAQNEAYEEAQPMLGGILEFFLRIPDLKELAIDQKTGEVKAGPLIDALHLEAVHSLSGHLTFEGPKTHLQATILGDTSEGTLFDICASGQASPASLSFVPAEAISYNSTQINFTGIYTIVKRVARAAFPQGQQGNADLIDTMAQARLGMPLPDALGLLTGEFASTQTSSSMDPAKHVYFLGIRKKPETLKLIRALLGDRVTSERNEGSTTFMKISLGGNQGSAGVAQWSFFNLAVTDDMILGASRTETLREMLTNRSKPGSNAGLAAVPQFQVSRSGYPVNLTGISYFDFQRVDWLATKDRWIQEAKKGATAKSTGLAQKQEGPTVTFKGLEWLDQVNPEVFKRHLHYSTSASWKDSKGVHWDQWVE